ncbi:alpha/beta hydrolase [Paraburkholderia sp. DHOC27]|nr:alpha/beta hydrolase [Paraburkholderia sp. DHOC27]
MTQVVPVRHRARMIGLLLMAFACAASAKPVSLQTYLATEGPPADAIYPYGPAPSQRAEYFAPSGERQGPAPVVILVHGGCWQSRYGGLAQFRSLAAAFARQGIAAWNIEYRRVDEEGGGFPGTYNDIASAIDELSRNAGTLKIDLTRVVAVGHSAGAQLALWAASRGRIPENSPLWVSHSLRIPTVVSLGGLPDLRNDADVIRKSCGIDADLLTGAPGDSRPDVFADTSPIDLLPAGIRTVSINGDDDTIAPPRLARRYADAAGRAGDSAIALTVPDAGHFDEVMTDSPVWPVLLSTVRKALGEAQ